MLRFLQAQQGIGISGVASGWAAGPSTDSEDDPDAEQQTGGQRLLATPHWRLHTEPCATFAEPFPEHVCNLMQG